MKLNKYFMLGLAGLAFAACSNEDGLPGNGDDGESKTLVISISGISSGAGTKATGVTDPWSKDDGDGVNNIKSLTLLFTNADGIVQYSYASTSTTLPLLKKDGMKFTGVKNVTAVYAVANKTVNLSQGANINTLVTELSEQGLSLTPESTDKPQSKVIYVGGDTQLAQLASEPAQKPDGSEYEGDEVHEFGEKGNFYAKAEITLRPILSRIQINSIKIATAGQTETFPDVAGGGVEADEFRLTWENFKPVLHGVYLNNFYNKFTNLTGATTELQHNEEYANAITGGTWMFGENNFTADAAYVSYNTNAYGSLLTYGAEEEDDATGITYTELMTTGKCIAFNVFVPFNIVSGNTLSTTNPTIHFQFETGTDVDNYTTKYVYATTVSGETGHTAGAEVTSSVNQTDYDFVSTCNYNFNYLLPGNTDYMFANVRKLFSENTLTTELTLEPGKIYNMNVVITPVNMQYDLNSADDAQNVVVTITVADFTEENIFPGLDE